MLIITDEAKAYIRSRNAPIFLDLPPLIDCCIHLRESPSVRFGRPHDPENYELCTIDGIEVLLPLELPRIPLTIVLARFLGFRRLAVEGWRLA